ncbi:MAG: hypothetical protein Q4E39_01800 [bacterium]|nr:hypothetical protein [bacterium]
MKSDLFKDETKEEKLDNEEITDEEEKVEDPQEKINSIKKNKNIPASSLPNDDFRSKMIKMFGIVIVGLIVILIVGFIISLIVGKKYNYAMVEDEMKNAAVNYFKDNKGKLPKNAEEVVEISTTVLANNKYMKTLDKYLKNTSCSGKVSVEKVDDKSYSYTPTLTCKNYTTTKLYDKIISNMVTDGFGVYNINNEYVYRGDDVNNYVKFSDSDRIWRVIKVTSSNEVVLISNDKTKNRFVWDERYNNQYEDNYGLNVYKNSYISSVLKKLYDNSLNDDEDEFYSNQELEILTKEEKTKVVEFDACVGTRADADTSKDGSTECQTIEKTKMTLLSTNDFLNASLDSNCNSTTKPDCQNYNYLVTDYNYWLANGSSNESSKIYRFTSSGYLQASYGNIESYARVVIHLSENVMLEKGKGTKDNPYVVR